MVYKWCPGCRGPLREFCGLRDDKELAFVRAEKKDFAPEAYIRCAVPGCRRYQRQLNWRDGGYFPKPDAKA
ncbi:MULTISPECIES: hypothetical protein [unclassified Streptomyces]|jgi:hypothetical protein|uniref:Uncharacterized protein n=1 Tax=Streptomyces sp. R08 TaxID=3238624 RepID=A0AB39M3Z0_9ACTN|nr:MULTISPECIES: hypothetical protein [unclassified Streptomyces]MCX4811095.1 hypothetical protein [Streptomyces sp. NBC_01239]